MKTKSLISAIISMAAMSSAFRLSSYCANDPIPIPKPSKNGTAKARRSKKKRK